MKLSYIISYVIGEVFHHGERHNSDKFTAEDLSKLRQWCITKKSPGVSELHGVQHWDRVAKFGKALSERTKADIAVVLCFAYLHDVARENDLDDIGHGPRAALLVDEIRETLLRKLTEAQIATLKMACKYHTIKHCSIDVTVDTCFDADRLDLPRSGITVDPKRLATNEAREFINSPEYSNIQN